MDLNAKQKKFVNEYIKTANATRSALNAGYSAKSAASQGQRLLNNEKVSEAIKKRMEKLERKAIAEQEEILEYLTSLIRGEEKEETLAFQGDGVQEIKKIEVSSKDRIKAAELLGKRYSMWIDKQQIEHSGQVNFVDDLSESSD
ncbi:terminase small subunit [Aerococcaceae bacterium NML160702]|nr:terminase small subunit [Aerococcaceae bacterium NML160702]